jgi:hypothetical protein
MKVLIACEYSGIVRDAFSKKGHDAWSCDLLPTESKLTIKEGKHIQGDVLKILDDGWDMMIAHPPCTRLCNSGVRWLHERNLWDGLIDAIGFFNIFKKGRYCIENPIPHCYARDGFYYGCDDDGQIKGIGAPTQIIQPWMFGHGETKSTCLWLRGLPMLKPTNIVTERGQKIWKMGPSPDRAKLRSKTFPGIAQAMADQWG